MPHTLETTIERVNKLNARQNDLLEQLRRVLPAEYAGDFDIPHQDSTGWTWRSAIESLEDAAAAVDDLAATLFYDRSASQPTA